MDKTYSETQKVAAFDWNKALDRAILKEPDLSTIQRLYNKASVWTTCACGNQCAIIPRNDGQPEDDDLRLLGLDFMYDVGVGDWKGAKLSLKAIEERSAILIAQELEKLRFPWG